MKGQVSIRGEGFAGLDPDVVLGLFSDKGVTSLGKELGVTQDFGRLKEVVLEKFAEVFGSTMV